MVWLAFASMTAAAVLCLVWPLLRPQARPRSAAAPDVGFYRRQIADLDDDVARGLLPPDAAASTRAELGRRLIAAADRAAQDKVRFGPRATVLAVAAGSVVAVPAVAVAAYLAVGNPAYRDAPLASRTVDTQDVAAMIGRVEAHLASHPDDLRGQRLIAPIYMRLGRYEEAARAYGEIVRLAGDNPDDQAAYGQALVAAGDGVVTREARAAFDAALARDRDNPEARFFKGMAAEQDGDKAQARTIWQAMLDGAPADAPWRDAVSRRIAGLDGAPQAEASQEKPAAEGGPPSGPGAAAIAALPADQQKAAIRGMVDGLASRLAQDGHDPDGWLRLVRAYAVLGDADRSKQALADARRAMASDDATLGRLKALASELGLEG